MSPQMNDFSDNSFERLKDRIHLRLKEEMIEDRIFRIVQGAYTEVLRTQNIVLSRNERNRLLREVLKDTLEDMLLHLSGKR